jgi:hypothetical protein
MTALLNVHMIYIKLTTDCMCVLRRVTLDNVLSGVTDAINRQSPKPL